MEDSNEKTDVREWLHFRSDKKKEFKISENTFDSRRDTISVPKDFTIVFDDNLAPSSPPSEDKEARRRSKSHFSKLFHGLRSDSPTKTRSGSVSAGNDATPTKTPYDVSKKFVVSSPSNPAYESMNDSRSRLSLPEKKEVIEELIENRPTREDLVTRNILLMSDDLESLYWGPFALNRVTKLLAPATEFKTHEDPPHNPLFTEVAKWNIDNGIHRSIPLKLRIEGAEKDILIYKENFLGKDHVNYIGKDKEGAPVVVSVSKEQKDGHYATIIRNKAHDLFGYMKSKHFNKVIKKVFLISPDKYKGISFKTVKDAEQELSSFETLQIYRKYKFGVLYCKQGQVVEEDMFSNVQYSQHFTEFLSFLGSVIDLKGWEKFRGGLDVKSGYTGEKSVYTTFHDFEIMFHVAQFLPYSHTDRQQLERKRHLGNDVVVIIFQDDNSTPFVPGCINSEFNHVFIVVQYVPGKNTCYRIATVTKEDVPPFGPVFPADCVFEKGDIFREFLLAKMINGERAAMYAPDFAFKLSRTREALLTQIYDKFSKE